MGFVDALFVFGQPAPIASWTIRRTEQLDNGDHQHTSDHNHNHNLSNNKGKPKTVFGGV